MADRLTQIMVLITFVFFVPIFMMVLNVPGYNQASDQPLYEYNEEGANFNIVTFPTVFRYLGKILDLAKFTVLNMPIWLTLFYGIINIGIIMWTALAIRGGGN